MNSEHNAKLGGSPPQSRIMPSMTAQALASAATPAADVNAEDDRLRVVMARVASRDESALADLYDLSSARLFAVARRIAGSTTAAEEIVSDVFLQVWQRGERYDAERGRVITWLLTICRSRALDWLRRRDEAFSHHDPESLRAEVVKSDDDPYALTTAFKTGTEVRAAIETLDERERHLVGLAFFRGLTHQEISDHTCMPLGTVKTVIRNALSALRERLHHHCVVEESI